MVGLRFCRKICFLAQVADNGERMQAGKRNELVICLALEPVRRAATQCVRNAHRPEPMVEEGDRKSVV